MFGKAGGGALRIGVDETESEIGFSGFGDVVGGVVDCCCCVMRSCSCWNITSICFCVWSSLACESEKACSRADTRSLLMMGLGDSLEFEARDKPEEGSSAGK